MITTNNPLRPILVVDDEQGALESLSIALEFMGYTNVITCQSSHKALELLRLEDFEVVLQDMVMPDISGEQLLEEIVLEQPDVPVIMVTAIYDLDTAVRCMRRGAFDYVTKPVDPDRLSASLAKALERRSLNRQIQVLKRNTLCPSRSVPEAFAGFLTREPAVINLLRYCEAVAQSSEPVLITGETGVGKELIARGIHAASGRQGEFVPLNVAGLDDVVFADTLFGHKKGAYTGALQHRLGFVEKAAHGTLFLDEIGELSEISQVKLLRLLQEREFHPLGSDTPVLSTARIVVATNIDIQKAMESGSFRHDLYYRLKTHAVHLPPLRERKEDVPLLLEHFLEVAAEEMGKEPPSYPKELPQLLHTYHFPGNIRELRAMVFDAVSVHTAHVLSMQCFKQAIGSGQDHSQPSRPAESVGLFADLTTLPTLREASDALVDEAMARAQGNQRIAAGMLGITASALNKRLRQREAERPDPT